MVQDGESGTVKIPYPKSVIFIIGNELCERFSYYGAKAILVLYFRLVLEYTDDAATQAYHIFAMACYFTPVIGAIIADSLLGKFWTILSISILYATGNILLAISSIRGIVALTFIGLGFIAFGTGGIKPCVSAFGGDQFKPEQSAQLKQFFSLFYISINAGSLISTFLTPILRQDVSCFDRSDCYPLAFGVPAVLMVTALVLFVIGRFVTNYVMVPPQKDNVVVMVVKCVCHALARKIFGKGPKKEHWLEYSDDRYDSKTISEVKVLMRVLFLYLPLPIFWSLFDQTGSRWTLQALRMNGKLGGWTIKPDQIQVINPLLIILMIPVYEYVIYPLINRIGLSKPLRRMTVGGVLAGIAFFICAFVQFSIEWEAPAEQLPGHNHAVFINGLQCNVVYEENTTALPFGGSFVLPNIPRESLADISFTITVNGDGCSEKTYDLKWPSGASLKDEQNAVFYLSEKLISSSQFDTAIFNNTLVKPEHGGANLFTIFSLKNYNQERFTSTETNSQPTSVVLANATETEPAFGLLDQFEVEVKGTNVIVGVGGASGSLSLDQGASYVQLIQGDLKDEKNVIFKVTEIVKPNQLSVFMQILPYFIITCGEIMFSVTGLEFSYSQAPKSMKSVLQACWLLTVAFGNLIIAIIADSKIFAYQSYEFLFFGGLMIADMMLFAVMAYYYVPSTINNEEEEGAADVKPEVDSTDSGLGGNGLVGKGKKWED